MNIQKKIIESVSKKDSIKNVKSILTKNSEQIINMLNTENFYNLFDIYIDNISSDIVSEKKDKDENLIIETAMDMLRNYSIELDSKLSKNKLKIIDNFMDNFDFYEDKKELKGFIIELVDDNFKEFIINFLKTKHKEPTTKDLEEYIKQFTDTIVDEYAMYQNDENFYDEELPIDENNDNVFDEYIINYTIDEYEQMELALTDLKNMINDYNVKNPSNKINMNIIDNTIHAKINRRIIVSRLKKSAANSIWELLRELNFDFNWIQNNQNNGVTATFYEGRLEQNGISYSNIQHFIVYYDAPIVAMYNGRLKKLAEQILLLPEPNSYYVILNDAFSCSVNNSKTDVEQACSGIKRFSNFVDAEKWLLSEKELIVAREGNSIPNDNSVWKKYEENIYSNYYNETRSVPSNEKTEYSIIISLSNTSDAKDLYKKWEKKYESLTKTSNIVIRIVRNG